LWEIQTKTKLPEMGVLPGLVLSYSFVCASVIFFTLFGMEYSRSDQPVHPSPKHYQKSCLLNFSLFTNKWVKRAQHNISGVKHVDVASIGACTTRSPVI
jgi:hypothetical protein